MARVLSELSIQDPSLLETDLKQAASTYYHTYTILKDAIAPCESQYSKTST